MTIKVTVSALALCAFSLAPALFGQAPEDKKQPQQREQQADRPGEVTLTGCLTEDQGSYMLATSSGEQVTAHGSGLNRHKNHTVKLTGRASDDGGKKMLSVTKIEMVSTSCSK